MPRGPQTLELPTGATNARIAGFLGTSSAAWPGRHAATLQIAGCEMRCPYCYAPELISSAHRCGATLADILAHLSGSSPRLEGVVVSGGEPTTDAALPDLLRALRAEGLPVKLDTSGSEPDMLAEVLDEGLVDFVALDVKATPERYDAVAGAPGSWANVERSIRALLESGVDHEFRVTCYPLAVSLGDLSAIARQVTGARRFVLQQFCAQRTFDPAARSVTPYPAAELLRAVDRCNPYAPTVVRGA